MSSSADAGRLRALVLAPVFGILALLCLAVPALAREEIRSFAADVALRTDGSVEVTETLEVNAEGIEIRRGIYRDLPTLLTRADGSPLRSTLTVHAVTRDGQPEPFTLEDLERGFKRIRIGDPDVFLRHGAHRYTIRYTMTRMDRRFDDRDELVWNVTGNYWVFPILSASATLRLPDGARISELTGYTGEPGSVEQALTATRTGDAEARFASTRALAPGEGLTVAVAFQKGVLAAPGTVDGILGLLSDWRDRILPVLAVLLVLAYNYFAWNKVGRDPSKGTIIPLFHPPKGFSPALVHYIHHMGFKQDGWTAFTASIFDLGVKGLVTIENMEKIISVRVTDKEPAEKLPPGESLLYAYLRSARVVRIGKSTGVELNRKRAEFVSALEAENRQAYFRNNRGYVAVGVLLSLACLVGLVLADVLEPVWLIFGAAAGVAIGLFTSAFSKLWNGSGFAKFMLVVWIAVAGSNLAGGFSFLLQGLSFDAGIFGAVSIVLLNVVFAILLRAPTVQGRKVMDQIEGFRMYIETAEQERLNLVDEPPMTVERFEAILPFAIALGVEKPWSKYFESELARHAEGERTGSSYSPGWYRGGDFSSGRLSNTLSSMAAGMSAAMVSAQPVSSSSSGFSSRGGGGSGSGGGGGGGGGW